MARTYDGPDPRTAGAAEAGIPTARIAPGQVTNCLTLQSVPLAWQNSIEFVAGPEVELEAFCSVRSSVPCLERGTRIIYAQSAAGVGRVVFQQYEWPRVLRILDDNPELINFTRPGGTSGYTVLDQGAHGKAPVDVVIDLVCRGGDEGSCPLAV